MIREYQRRPLICKVRLGTTSRKAYEFLRPLHANGFPKNFGVGLDGSKEAVLPIESEFYQTARQSRRSGRWQPFATYWERRKAKSLTESSRGSRNTKRRFLVAEKKIFAFGDRSHKSASTRPTVLKPCRCGLGLTDEDKRNNDRELCQTRSRDRLGHAHHFEPRTEITWWGLSLRFGVAAIHWLGFGGRYRLSQPQAAYDNIACERILPWMVARTRDKSFVR